MNVIYLNDTFILKGGVEAAENRAFKVAGLACLLRRRRHSERRPSRLCENDPRVQRAVLCSLGLKRSLLGL